MQNTQTGEANQILQQENQLFNESQATLAPVLSYYQNLISGNPGALMTAAGPQISNITGGQNAAIETIKNTVPQGAGQQYALSQVPIQENSQIASTLNSDVNQAYSSLGGLAQGLFSGSVQELGGGSSLLSGASSTNTSLLNAQEQGKSSTMGLLGTLLSSGGTGGSSVGSNLLGSLGNGLNSGYQNTGSTSGGGLSGDDEGDE